MAAPPLEPGAVHVRPAEPLPAVALPMVGVPGRVAGVTAFDSGEDAPVPRPFTAATVNR